MSRTIRNGLAAVFLLLFTACARATATEGIALHGRPKYQPGFSHFDYVNPRAPKGGHVRLASTGTFDSFNPFIVKGTVAEGIGLLYDTLMVQSSDEPFSEYGLIAKSIDVAPDRTWVRFNLRPQARFQDGTPITPQDVIFTFNALKTKGSPIYSLTYADVTKVEQTGPHQVTFHFRNGNNSELPLIVGQMPVLPAHYWKHHDFGKTTLDVPVGSGPYTISAFQPGRYVVFKRDPNYWGKDLPVNRGRFNFNTIRYDYYRDATVVLEAFKAGNFDFREENISKNWAIGYDSPALRAGMIKKKLIPNKIDQGMQGYFFNLRRPMFKDPRVRRALGYAFDFKWTNAALFYGAYTRTKSFFANSDLAARHLPDAAELKLLDPYRSELPPQVFTKVYQPPKVAGPEGLRHNLVKALDLLRQAGWVIRDGRLVNKRTGQPMRFVFLQYDPSFERVTLPFIGNLKRLGIQASMRVVDPTQYQNRVNNFDFDITTLRLPESASPGNELRDYFSSAAADAPGSSNVAGIKNPVVDALIKKIITAKTRQQLVDRVHALDRVLLWNHYVIPQWYLGAFRIAYWDKFGHPKVTPKYALGFPDTWWVDPAKARRVHDWRQSGR